MSASYRVCQELNSRSQGWLTISSGRASNRCNFSCQASEQNFRQSLKLKFVAGKGGDGISEVNAIGGKGADIILQASRRVSSLQNVADKLRLKVVTASDGLPASKEMIVAPSIDNRIVKVPPGVEIYDEQEQLLASLDAHLHRFKVVRGGEGGCLENNFIGQHGETRSVVINAKLIADVGMLKFLFNTLNFVLIKISLHRFCRFS